MARYQRLCRHSRTLANCTSSPSRKSGPTPAPTRACDDAGALLATRSASPRIVWAQAGRAGGARHAQSHARKRQSQSALLASVAGWRRGGIHGHCRECQVNHKKRVRPPCTDRRSPLNRRPLQQASGCGRTWTVPRPGSADGPAGSPNSASRNSSVCRSTCQGW